MAAAQLFTSLNHLEERIASLAVPTNPRSLSAMRAPFSDVSDPYWDRRLSLGGRIQHDSISLLGLARVNAILVNVLVPYIAATRPDCTLSADALDALPASDDHQVLRQTAYWLFGPDHPRSLYRNGLRRQGLTQIFHDFCLQDRSRCANCPFPDALRTVRAERPHREV